MNAEYWAVGASSPSPLPLAHADVSKHLVADWVPSLPAAVSTSLMGWPVHLLDIDSSAGVDFLALGDEARGGERQWNGVLSWMLGVVGARHVLESEGYLWVAPMSAFYPEARRAVDISKWHPMYPSCRLKAHPSPTSSSRLRPDYVAIRPRTLGSDWAVAEAKGTTKRLTKMGACPPNWRDQSRNVVLESAGRELHVPRHLVVATRSNPSARYTKTRRVQIRAWNSEAEAAAPDDLRVEVAAAHLFGLCRNLGLRKNAVALALATAARREAESRLFGRRGLDDAVEAVADDAEAELEARPLASDDIEEGEVTRTIDSAFGPVEVRIEAPILRLVRALRIRTDPQAAAAAVDDAEEALNPPLLTQGEALGRGSARLPSGVRVSIPRLLEG